LGWMGNSIIKIARVGSKFWVHKEKLDDPLMRLNSQPKVNYADKKRQIVFWIL
jgi:hypothetical protein